MVRYKKKELGTKVEDRRGQGGRRPGLAIGGGIGGILALILALFLGGGGGGGGGGLEEILEQLQPGGQVVTPSGTIDPATDPYAEFREYMNAVYVDNDALWKEIFEQSGRTDYRTPGFVIFDGFTNSGCGGADERIGPHYCPLDESIYLDFDFFAQLRDQFGAKGDLAPAYVLSHEFGHHIQTVIGVNERVRQLQQEDPGRANDLSVRMELQADCFAGVWASTLRVGTETGANIELDPGEIREAIEAAEAVGDDRIQGQAQGQVNPETWTHGSSAQRSQWFTTGYDSGDPAACDTFS